MKSNNKQSAGKCHGLEGLPLFDWRQTPPIMPMSPAGWQVIRKFGVSPGIADLVAELAGLGPREVTR